MEGKNKPKACETCDNNVSRRLDLHKSLPLKINIISSEKILSMVSNELFEIYLAERRDESVSEKPLTTTRKLLIKWASPGESRLLGVIGKCMIPGCDVHLLTLQQYVIRHFDLSSAIPDSFENARAYLKAPEDGVIAVLVYNDHMEVLMVDGTVRPLVHQ